MSSRRLSPTGWSVSRCLRTCSNRCRKNSRVRWCRSRNSRITLSSSRSTSPSGRDATRAMIFSTRLSFASSNGRMTTRELVGFRTIPVRLTSMSGAYDLFPGDVGPSRGRGNLPCLAECRQGAFQQVPLGQREEEGEGRFGPLVAVDPVLLEPVAAAARGRVVQILAQVVAAEEPLEGGAGLGHPGGVLGGPVRLQAGGDGRAGLDRLLVEPGRHLPLAVEPVAADRPEVLLRGRLHLDQPAQGMQTHL